MQLNSYVSDRHKKRKRRRAYFFTAVALIAAYLLFFIVQWFIFHSPIFRVNSVVVVGNSSVASSDVVALVEATAIPKHETFPALFGFDNMLLWPDRVASSELPLIPQLARVTVSKNYFSHTVTITADERAPFGIWCFSGQPGSVPTSGVTSNAPCYWFDNTGTIFEKSFDTQGNLIFVVNDTAQAPRGLNQKVLSDEFLPNFLSIMNVLHESGLAVTSIELSDLSLEQVDVLIANGPTIYFSLRFPADEYLPVIQKLMLGPSFDSLQYIDCTTQNRMYYK